jgi:predicted MFS family arabinose efflux permease
MQLALPLLERHGPELPACLLTALQQRAEKNRTRWRRVRASHDEVARALIGIDFAVLKGFALCPDFASSPESRVQYDIDLLFRPDTAVAARDAVATLGYEPIRAAERFPVDHLPTMIRKTGWEWRGDYFDPEIPVSVELHYRLWDAGTESFDVPGLDEFWRRKQRRNLFGLEFTSLSRIDAAGYACLHVLRHLLRGNVRSSHVYELAYFLERSHSDEQLWGEWANVHGPELRRIQAICFALARTWFPGALPAPVEREIETMPAPVARWIDEFAMSPLAALFAPNKDELWLHLALLPSLGLKARVFTRRMLPMQLPGPVDAVYVPDEQLTAARRVQRAFRYTMFVASRAFHHARTLPAAGVSWIRWTTGLSRDYWRFFATAALFDIGLFIFFLLYNVYLLHSGFDERTLGVIASAMTLGSIAGSLAAPAVLARFGVRGALATMLTVLACASALRVVFLQSWTVLPLTAICGACTGTWAVALSPTVAELTADRSRPLAFSFILGEGIGLGVIAGYAGGRLPGLFGTAGSTEIVSFRAALIVSCLIVLAAIMPLRRLRSVAIQDQSRAFAKPDAALIRFLIALAVWHLGTGAFNPFFNAFFVRMHVGIERIGLLFSGSQLAQTIVVLLSPMVFRGLGLVRGVSGMQAATAIALAGIALSGSVNTAAAAYIAYMAFQYMSEPGIFSYLMSSVPAEKRTTASSLNFVVAFGAQAVASAIAGSAIARAGYTNVLYAASILCVIAALLFGLIVPSRQRTEP